MFCRTWSVHQPLLTLVQIEDDNPYANLEKKSKKGRKAEKNAAKPPAEKPLNHSLDIMGAFAKLSIEAPTSVSKVGGAHGGCTGSSMRLQCTLQAVHRWTFFCSACACADRPMLDTYGRCRRRQRP